MIFMNIFNLGLIFLIVNQVLFTVASNKPKNNNEVDIPSDDDLDFPDTSIQDDDFSEDLLKERGIQRRPLFDTKNPELTFMDEDTDEEVNDEDDKFESDDYKADIKLIDEEEVEPSRKTRFPTRIGKPIKITRPKIKNQKTIGQKDTRRIGGGILPDWDRLQRKSLEPCMVYPDCNNNMG